ncbi:MAG TPA: FmdB family transcriptional regulator [Pirellulaceae bacterium]|nr:FmdB family transcriptional regulator [Pirellulaceae bacterium]
MPIYVYELITDDDSPGEQFEIFQKMADPPLTKHPESGQPVRRVFCPPAIGGQWSDSAMAKNVADDKKLDRMGFTKYVKAGDGHYEKTAGTGPDVISRDQAISAEDI